MAREALYTAQVSGMVSEDMKAEIERLADAYRVSQGEVMRLGLESDGLKSVEAILRARRMPAPVEVGSPFSG
jgi:hypothetical protein